MQKTVKKKMDFTLQLTIHLTAQSRDALKGTFDRARKDGLSDLPKYAQKGAFKIALKGALELHLLLHLWMQSLIHTSMQNGIKMALDGGLNFGFEWTLQSFL